MQLFLKQIIVRISETRRCHVSDGIVTHPYLVKFKGYVAKPDPVHAPVTVHDKFASGTDSLSFATSGRGKRSGRAGSAPHDQT